MSKYTANRFFGGNFFYPMSLEFLGDKVQVSKPGLFRQWERTIPLSKIASVTATTGILLGSVRVESSGGAEDIVASGFNKADVQQFRAELESALTKFTQR